MQPVTDGDDGFLGVNDRAHPATLPPGMVASASNTRFDHADGRPRWAAVIPAWANAGDMGGDPLFAVRWFDPETGEQAAVVMTNGARSGGSEDGGVGRCWKLVPGATPVAVSLNGHDCWGACRLVPCRQGLVLLRHGNLRHYWPAANTDTGSNHVTLNVLPQVLAGDRVLVGVADPGYTLPAPLQPDTHYWIDVTGSDIEFFEDEALASQITLTSAGTGYFWLERADHQPGPEGNGAPPLMLQASWDGTNNRAQSAWDTGWAATPNAVPMDVAVSDTVWDAPAHRWETGQAISLTQDWTVTGSVTYSAGELLYIRKLDNHHLTLHPSADDALAGDNALTDSGSGATANTTGRPNSFSGQPIVPLTEGIWYKQRLVGLPGQQRVAVSDPGDPLHFTPFTGALVAALGNGDPLTGLAPLGDDTLLLGTPTQILGVTGLSGDTWDLIEITREYGPEAPLSWVQVGKDSWMLARAGVVSIVQTEEGRQQGQAIPMSEPIASKVAEIDWSAARHACAAWFDNKYVLAVPLKGQPSNAIVNNCLLVFNFLTQQWDGWWSGSNLRPICFFRLSVNSTERLCWLNADGSVAYFVEDGTEDLTYAGGEHGYSAIVTEVVTRAYRAGTRKRKDWHEAQVELDALNPSYSIAVRTNGVNQQVTLRDGVTLDPTVFLTHDTAPYDPTDEGDRAELPYREDYSQVITDEGIDLGSLGVSVDTHQTHVEMLKSLQARSRTVQLVLSNSQGSVRWRTIDLDAEITDLR